MKKKKRIDKRKFSLKENYVKSLDYIKESRNFIYGIIILFFVFTFIGFFVKPPEEISQKILDYLKTLLEETAGFNRFEMIRFIFLNNLQSSFVSLISGFFFGILPFFAGVFNGYILGFVASAAVEQAGFASLLDLVPHGIFELPAIFISLGLGIKFGTFLFRKEKKESFIRYLAEGLRVFVFIVLPLLIIAAIIEGLLIFI